MGVNSLPKTVMRQRRDCDLNPSPTAPESSTLTTQLPSHHVSTTVMQVITQQLRFPDSAQLVSRRHQLYVTGFSDSRRTNDRK